MAADPDPLPVQTRLGPTLFVITHHHADEDCRFAYAAWHGFASPLRQRRTLASCADGGHTMWWLVAAAEEADALALLPPFVACRATALAARLVPVP
jgi:hypothetical protein